MSGLQQDLHERWLPSPEQMKLADALLTAGYDAVRDGLGGDRGVYTAHLLVHKEYAMWTRDVELEFLDGVFLTRDAVLQYEHNAAKRSYEMTGIPVIGGWAWHSHVGYAAVWEDIASIFPIPEWSTRHGD